MAGFTIGRSADNDIVLDDQTVSRKHAELEAVGGGRYRLRDLGSSLGTFVRDGDDWAQIEEADVGNDTRVRFGEYETTIADIAAQTGGAEAAAQEAAPAPEPKREPAPQQPAPQQAQGQPAGGGAAASAGGMDRKTKLILFGGGGALLLLVIIVAVVMAVSGGGGSIGGASATAVYDACVESRGNESQCRCIADVAGDTLDAEEREILVLTMRGDGNEEARQRLIAERMSSVTERISMVRAMIRFQTEAARRCGRPQ